jgi:hypothetical protein
MPLNHQESTSTSLEHINKIFNRYIIQLLNIEKETVNKIINTLDIKNIKPFNSFYYLVNNKDDSTYEIKSYDTANYFKNDIKLYYNISLNNFTLEFKLEGETTRATELTSKIKTDDSFCLINIDDSKYIIYHINNKTGLEEIFTNTDTYTIFNKYFIDYYNINDSLQIHLKNFIVDIPGCLIVVKEGEYYIMILPIKYSTHEIFAKQIEVKTKFEIIQIDLYCPHICIINDNYKKLFAIFRENIYHEKKFSSPFQLYYKNANYSERLNRNYYLNKFNKILFEDKLKDQYNINIESNVIKDYFTFIKYFLMSTENEEPKILTVDSNISSIKNELITNCNTYIKKNPKNTIKIEHRLVPLVEYMGVVLYGDINGNINSWLKILYKNINYLQTEYIKTYSTKLYQEFLFENRDLIYTIIIIKKGFEFYSILRSFLRSEINENELLLYYQENLSIDFVDLIFDEPRHTGQILLEIFNFTIFRKKQTELMTKILKNISNSDNLYEVNQLIMGMGKTAIITPSIILHTKYCESYQKIINNQLLCLPETLINQTKHLLNSFNFLNIYNRFEVISDTDLKNKLIENYSMLNDFKYLLIIDEFDSLYNPLTSNLNKPDIKIDINNTTESNLYLYINQCTDLIIENIDSNNYNPEIDLKLKLPEQNQPLDPNNFALIKLNTTLTKCCTMKYNLNYGLNKINPTEELLKDKYFRAVPYSAVDTPVTNSDFSEIDFVFILTVMSLSYCEFRLIDYIKIMNTILAEFKKNSEIEESDNKLFEIIGKDIIKEYNNKLYINEQIKNKINKNKLFFKKYLINIIVNNLQFTIKQKNISFMDVIGLKNVIKIGFSGTTNLTLPNYTDFKPIDFKKYKNICQTGGNDKYTHVFNTINDDTDASGSIYYSILLSESTDPIKLTNGNILEQITNIFRQRKYNCLIDTAGLLFTRNSSDIIHYLINQLKDQFDRYVYIDDNNNKKIIKWNKGQLLESYYNNEIITNKDFILYDNKHIIGQDIKQSFEMSGLCTVNNKLTLTLLAQGIYRLRKINRGHTINFIVDSNTFSDKPTRSNILIKTYSCEETTKYTDYELEKLIQNYKTLYRNCHLNYLDNTKEPSTLFDEDVYNQYNTKQLDNYREFFIKSLEKYKNFKTYEQEDTQFLNKICDQILLLNTESKQPVINYQQDTTTAVSQNINTSQNITRETNYNINKNPRYKISTDIVKLLDLLDPEKIKKNTKYYSEYPQDTCLINKFFKINNIILLNCNYNGDIYYIYLKVQDKYYFILINSFIFAGLKDVFLKNNDSYDFIIKKSIDNIVYQRGNITQVLDKDINLEVFINFIMGNNLSLINLLRANLFVCDMALYFYKYNNDTSFIATNIIFKFAINILLTLDLNLEHITILQTKIRDPIENEETTKIRMTMFTQTIATLYSLTLPEKSRVIKINSRAMFETINQITCEINVMINKYGVLVKFIDNLFELANSTSTSNKYYKQYIKYKLKYLKLKNQLK